MKPKRAFFYAGLAATTLIGAGWWLYNRRPRERVVSQESLDDPAVSRAFDFMATIPHMRLLRWYVARRAVQLVPYGKAVDLGCGPGYLVITLAKQASGLQVTGIDLSDEMLDRADAYARRAGVSARVAFKKGDAGQIPFPDASLDLVVSTLSLHHWRAPIDVLDEIDRVLRPGGAFMIFDLRRDMALPFWLLMWFVTRFVVPPVLRHVNEPLGSCDAAYTPQEAQTLAQSSQLSGWHVTPGPLWLLIEGQKESKDG